MKINSIYISVFEVLKALLIEKPLSLLNAGRLTSKKKKKKEMIKDGVM